MKKLAITITVLLAVSVLSSVSLLNNPRAETVYIDPLLSQSWSTASSNDVVDVVITLDHIPTQSDAQAIAGLSIASVPMTALPMVLARTTYGSLSSIRTYSGVVSLFQDRALTYFGQVKTVTHSAGEVPVQHSWWNDIMHVSKAWDLGFKGQGVTVAVVDSGIDATNPSLGYSFPIGLSQAPGRVIQNVKVLTIGELLSTQEQHPPLGPDQLYIENQPNTDTTGGHGTSVSGLIAGTGAVGNGIYMGAAPEANLVGLGAGDTLVIFHVIASYNYILDHQDDYRIKIVNNSWGSDFECSLLVEGFMPDPEACRSRSPISAATKAAHDKGITTFFAAGNSGPGHSTINPFSEPAWVISVGAGTETAGLTTFSSRGVPENPDQQPDLVAPGVNVISTRGKTGATDGSLTISADTGNIADGLQPYYTTFAGTSAASPMAAGVGAVVLSASNLTPDQLKATMMATTNPMLGYLSYHVGTGYVDAFNAVRAAQGKGFKPATTRADSFGTQRYIYTVFIGGSVVITGAAADINFPVFAGAQNITFNFSWTTPATTVLQWEFDIYGPNDYAVADCGRTRDDSDCVFSPTLGTSVSYTVTDASFIASLNNLGFNAGTWAVTLLNFNQGDQVTMTVDVNYGQRSQTSMKTSQTVHSDDQASGGLQGDEVAILQTYNGLVQARTTLSSAGSTSVSADITSPAGTLVSVVQIVVVDSSGSIFEVRGAFVMTQADLSQRANQIQQLLLSTIDPSQTLALQTELNLIETTLPTAPTTEVLPPLS